MNKAMWVYLPHSEGQAARRVLLLEQKNKAPKAEEGEDGKSDDGDESSAEEKALEAQKKTLQGLGSTAAS